MRSAGMIRSLVAIVLVFLPTGLFAQTLAFNAGATYLQTVRVGLMDEFFDRFNGIEVHPDLPTDSANQRRDNLLMLFDLAQFKSKEDSLFVEAGKFADIVVKDSLYLHYEDSTWFAIAHCKGTMDNRSIKFDLYLTVEHRKENMYKWVIANVGGSLFDTPAGSSSGEAMLYPDDHETNFLSLRRMTQEQPKNVFAFMGKGISYHPASVFVYLVYSGKLKINYVDELEFVFTQIPDYIFNVKYVEREQNNAGWLISKLNKISIERKKYFLESLHPRMSDTQGLCLSDSALFCDADNDIDHVNNTDIKATYERRLLEKMSLMKDYITFIQRENNLRTSSIYKVKMESLFAKTSKVFLQDENTDSVAIVSVEEFCDMVANKNPECFVLETVAAPVWSDELLSSASSEYLCEASSRLRMFTGEETSNDLYDQTLYIYKENTEDGDEWLPVFGDLTVRIKED